MDSMIHDKTDYKKFNAEFAQAHDEILFGKYNSADSVIVLNATENTGMY